MGLMRDALEKAAVTNESPATAAARLWRECGHRPVQMLELFYGWMCGAPERMAEVLGEPFIKARCRRWLSEKGVNKNWEGGSAFQKALDRLASDLHGKQMQQYREHALTAAKPAKSFERSYDIENKRAARERKRRGITRVRADIDQSGRIELVGEFANIRINGRELAEVTVEEALKVCELREKPLRFVRAICGQCSHPGQLIGKQWSVEIIKKAEAIANRGQDVL